MLRTVSNTYAQVARAQSCANHVQHIERLSRASVMLRATWDEGTAQLLSLTELKSHLFELYFIGWTIKPLNSLCLSVDQLNESCEIYSMKISTSKTEVMTISKRPDKLDININGTQLKQSNEFKYLGSVFTENGKLDREIETRCQKANAVSYQLAPFTKTPQHFHQY